MSLMEVSHSFLADVTLGQAALFVGTLAAVGEGVRRVWPTLRRLVLFADTITGDVERGIPGLIERLVRVEERLAAVAVELTQLRADLRRSPRRATDPPDADYRFLDHDHDHDHERDEQ